MERIEISPYQAIAIDQVIKDRLAARGQMKTEIKVALAREGITLEEISSRIGRSKTLVSMILSENPYHLDERKVKLRQWELGVSNTDIAGKLGVSVASITRHIKGQRHNEIVQKGIARALRLPINKITKGNGDDARN